ncbi:amidase [Achromobacter sp. GG226]|uniref:amidase n=1 Tax=Verticiella alkaliphila TaxID=2779529 RepID=UPI001C0AEC1B|nr:amidase [Verticiella sp. GG226]MBU4610248.1 amidase [Verticiella sp. GG226]
MEPHELTAWAASQAIQAGTLTSEALVRSCLERIDARDADVRAWLHVDPAFALRWAREADKRPTRSPLHGLPFGVKDMIDTADLPTTFNSPLFQGYQPSRDAACVAILRSAGAVLLGKTDTVEFAVGGRKAATRHPRNFAHTPGGSSSGSAAAVGDRQVPLALGTQTGGSHIRPASFNGIYALKPTWGAVSREGAKLYAAGLDTIGWFGRCVEDLTLMAQAYRLNGANEDAAAALRDIRVGVCRSPVWKHIEPAGEQALALAQSRLIAAGVTVVDLELPAAFDGVRDAQDAIMRGEGRAAFLDLDLAHGEALHADFRAHVSNAYGYSPEALVAAYDTADLARAQFAAVLQAASVDVLLTPASPGEAPEGLHTTGNHVFNAIWTLLHVPCVAVPCTTGPAGLPVGVQLVAPRHRDGALLQMARALAPIIDAEGGAR